MEQIEEMTVIIANADPFVEYEACPVCMRTGNIVKQIPDRSLGGQNAWIAIDGFITTLRSDPMPARKVRNETISRT